MFPFTHICFARDVLGKLNNEIILGAVFPDTVIAGYLEHADTHQKCRAVFEYLTRIGVFRDFASGLITHGTAPEGLDYYCDEKHLNFEKGYAFEMARPLIDKVIKCCNLPEKMGWWKAHNFVEMAVETILYQKRPELHGSLAMALDDHELIMALSQYLSPFFGITTAKLAMSFPVYREFVTLDEITPMELAKKYKLQMARKHDIQIDIPETAAVIEEAVEFVTPTLSHFLTLCQTKVENLVISLSI